jgi:hypothetical protein
LVRHREVFLWQVLAEIISEPCGKSQKYRPPGVAFGSFLQEIPCHWRAQQESNNARAFKSRRIVTIRRLFCNNLRQVAEFSPIVTL